MIYARPTLNMKQGLKDLIAYIDSFKIKPLKAMTILEVGTYAGESAEIFADYFGTVYCVDLWDESKADDVLRAGMQEAEARVDELVKSKGNIIKIKGDSLTVCASFKKKVDIIYVDGAHDYHSVVADNLAWRARCNYFMAGHDYRQSKFAEVIRAVHETLGRPDKTFKDFSWIKRI